MVKLFCKLCRQSVFLTDWKAHIAQKQHLLELPFKLVITGSFTQDEIDNLYNYFANFGSIRSQAITQKNNKTVIEYRFWDARLYSEIIHKEHNIFDKPLSISWHKKSKGPSLEHVIQDEKMLNEKFTYRKVAILESLKELPTFDDELQMFQTNLKKIQNLMVDNQRIIQKDLEAVLLSKFPNSRLHMFGSLVTELSVHNSDINMFLDNTDSQLSTLDVISEQISNSELFCNISICSEKLKFEHKKTEIWCYLTIKNELPVATTELIKYYLTLNEKLKSVFLLIKFWADCYDLRGKNAFSSYAINLMIIFYLQNEYKLPSVFDLQKDNLPDEIEGWNCCFGPVEFENSELENSSVLNLMGGFFKFYANFDYFNEVLCTFLGSSIEKACLIKPCELPEFDDLKKGDRNFEMSSGLCIQDFFEHSKNVSDSVPFNVVGRFTAVCRNCVCLLYLSERDLLFKLFLNGNQNMNTFNMDLAGKNCLVTIQTVLLKICKDIFLCQVEESSLTYFCKGMFNFWDNRVQNLKKGLKNKITKEVEISSSLKNSEKVFFWKLTIHLSFEENLNRIMVKLIEEDGIPIFHVQHFLYIYVNYAFKMFAQGEFSDVTKALPCNEEICEAVKQETSNSDTNSNLKGHFKTTSANLNIINTEIINEDGKTTKNEDVTENVKTTASESHSENDKIISNEPQIETTTIEPPIDNFKTINESEVKNVNTNKPEVENVITLNEPQTEDESHTKNVETPTNESEIENAKTINEPRVETTNKPETDLEKMEHFPSERFSCFMSHKKYLKTDEKLFSEILSSNKIAKQELSSFSFALSNKIKELQTFDDQVNFLCHNLKEYGKKMTKLRKRLINDLKESFFSNTEIGYFDLGMTGLIIPNETLKIYFTTKNDYKTQVFLTQISNSKIFVNEGNRIIHKPTNIIFELCTKNDAEIKKMELIRYYINLDEKIFKVFQVLTFWNACTNKEKHELFSLLIIFFLQQAPYNLPSVSKLQKNITQFQDWNLEFEHLEYKECLKDASILKIIFGFFKFYETFNFLSYVVTPYFGLPIMKTSFVKPYQLPSCYKVYINTADDLYVDLEPCIEDPFIHTENLLLGHQKWFQNFLDSCAKALQFDTTKDLELLYNLMFRIRDNSVIERGIFYTAQNTELELQSWCHNMKKLLLTFFNDVMGAEVSNHFSTEPHTYSFCVTGKVRTFTENVDGLKKTVLSEESALKDTSYSLQQAKNDQKVWKTQVDVTFLKEPRGLKIEVYNIGPHAVEDFIRIRLRQFLAEKETELRKAILNVSEASFDTQLIELFNDLKLTSTEIKDRVTIEKDITDKLNRSFQAKVMRFIELERKESVEFFCFSVMQFNILKWKEKLWESALFSHCSLVGNTVKCTHIATQIQCNINIVDVNIWRNLTLIKKYIELHENIEKLMIFLEFWMNHHFQNYSKYHLQLLIIFYLQKEYQVPLPETLQNSASTPELKKLRQSTFLDLLFGFYTFLSQFDYFYNMMNSFSAEVEPKTSEVGSGLIIQDLFKSDVIEMSPVSSGRLAALCRTCVRMLNSAPQLKDILNIEDYSFDIAKIGGANWKNRMQAGFTILLKDIFGGEVKKRLQDFKITYDCVIKCDILERRAQTPVMKSFLSQESDADEISVEIAASKAILESAKNLVFHRFVIEVIFLRNSVRVRFSGDKMVHHFGHFLYTRIEKFSKVQNLEMIVKEDIPDDTLEKEEEMEVDNDSESFEDHKVVTKEACKLDHIGSLAEQIKHLHTILIDKTYTENLITKIRKDLNSAISSVYPKHEIVFYGSRTFGLAFADSDLNIYIDLGQEPDFEEDLVTLKVLLKCKFKDFSLMFLNGVLTLECTHISSKIICRLITKKETFVSNSEYISKYLQLNENLPTFFTLIKFWAQKNKYFSSCALYHLIINFLHKYEVYLVVDSTIEPDLSLLSDTTILKLLSDFFKYNGSFNYLINIVLPNSKEEAIKMKFLNQANLALSSGFCILNPLDQTKTVFSADVEESGRFTAHCRTVAFWMYRQNNLYNILFTDINSCLYLTWKLNDKERSTWMAKIQNTVLEIVTHVLCLNIQKIQHTAYESKYRCIQKFDIYKNRICFYKTIKQYVFSSILRTEALVSDSIKKLQISHRSDHLEFTLRFKPLECGVVIEAKGSDEMYHIMQMFYYCLSQTFEDKPNVNMYFESSFDFKSHVKQKVKLATSFEDQTSKFFKLFEKKREHYSVRRAHITQVLHKDLKSTTEIFELDLGIETDSVNFFVNFGKITDLTALYSRLQKVLAKECCFGEVEVSVDNQSVLKFTDGDIFCNVRLTNEFYWIQIQKVLKKYICCHDNIYKLTIFLKLWCQCYNLISREGFSERALYWMIVFFLQQYPYSLPKIYGTSLDTITPSKELKEASFFDLVFGFFAFYAQFDYFTQVISPFLGVSLDKSRFVQEYSLPSCIQTEGLHVTKNISFSICIQDPIEHNKFFHSENSGKFTALCRSCLLCIGEGQTYLLHRLLNQKETNSFKFVNALSVNYELWGPRIRHTFMEVLKRNCNSRICENGESRCALLSKLRLFEKEEFVNKLRSYRSNKVMNIKDRIFQNKTTAVKLYLDFSDFPIVSVNISNEENEFIHNYLNFFYTQMIKLLYFETPIVAPTGFKEISQGSNLLQKLHYHKLEMLADEKCILKDFNQILTRPFFATSEAQFHNTYLEFEAKHVVSVSGFHNVKFLQNALCRESKFERDDLDVRKLKHVLTGKTCVIKPTLVTTKNVNNLIRYYTSISESIFMFVTIIRLWNENEKDVISTEILFLLMIYFLQQEPYKLPSVENLQSETKHARKCRKYWNHDFKEPPINFPNFSLFDMVFGFLNFYEHFNYYSYVVSPFAGTVFRKITFLQPQNLPRSFMRYICGKEEVTFSDGLDVQDPFIHSKILSVPPQLLWRFTNRCRTYLQLLQRTKNLDSIFTITNDVYPVTFTKKIEQPSHLWFQQVENFTLNFMKEVVGANMVLKNGILEYTFECFSNVFCGRAVVEKSLRLPENMSEIYKQVLITSAVQKFWRFYESWRVTLVFKPTPSEVNIFFQGEFELTQYLKHFFYIHSLFVNENLVFDFKAVDPLPATVNELRLHQDAASQIQILLQKISLEQHLFRHMCSVIRQDVQQSIEETIFFDCEELNFYVRGSSLNIVCSKNLMERCLTSENFTEVIQLTPQKIKCKHVKTNVICYISYDNSLSRKYKIIATFLNMNSQLRSLYILIKFWAALNGFISDFELTDYALHLLIIFFLRQKPVNFPPVMQLKKELPLLPQFKFDDALMILLEMFFDFYAKFDFVNDVISPKSGLIEKKINFPACKKNPRPLVCIQDLLDDLENDFVFLKWARFGVFCRYSAQFLKKQRSPLNLFQRPDRNLLNFNIPQHSVDLHFIVTIISNVFGANVREDTSRTKCTVCNIKGNYNVWNRRLKCYYQVKDEFSTDLQKEVATTSAVIERCPQEMVWDLELELIFNEEAKCLEVVFRKIGIAPIECYQFSHFLYILLLKTLDRIDEKATYPLAVGPVNSSSNKRKRARRRKVKQTLEVVQIPVSGGESNLVSRVEKGEIDKEIKTRHMFDEKNEGTQNLKSTTAIIESSTTDNDKSNKKSTNDTLTELTTATKENCIKSEAPTALESTLVSKIKMVHTFDDQVRVLKAHFKIGTLTKAQSQQVLEDLRVAISCVDVHIFGSYASNLHVKNSDLNLIIYQKASDSNKNLQTVVDLLKKDNKFMNVSANWSDSGSTISCAHKTTKASCLICIDNNKLVIKNSELIQYYMSLDVKLIPAMIMLHYWAERHDLIKGGFSKYALNLMLIFYLQHMPHKIPAVKNLQPNVGSGDFKKQPFQSTTLKLASISEIVMGFFKFYSDFDYFSFILSPFYGLSIAKTRFLKPFTLPEAFNCYKTMKSTLRVDEFLCLQDPFEHSKNILADVPSESGARFAMICKNAVAAMEMKASDSLLKLLTPQEIQFSFSINSYGSSWKTINNDIVKILSKIFGFSVRTVFVNAHTTKYEGETEYNVFHKRVSVLKATLCELPQSAKSIEKEVATTERILKILAKSALIKSSVTVTSGLKGKSLLTFEGDNKGYLCYYMLVKLKKFLLEEGLTITNENVAPEVQVKDGSEASTTSKEASEVLTSKSVDTNSKKENTYNDIKDSEPSTCRNETEAESCESVDKNQGDNTTVDKNQIDNTTTSSRIQNTSTDSNTVKATEQLQVTSEISSTSVVSYSDNVAEMLKHKTLLATREKKTFTEQMKFFCDQLLLEKSLVQKHEKLVSDDLSKAITFIFTFSKIWFMGLSTTGFFTRDSHFEIFIDELQARSYSSKPIFDRLSEALVKSGKFQNVSVINVGGMIKCQHAETKIFCNIFIKDKLLVQRSELIAYYLSLDEKLKHFIFLIKSWSDFNELPKQYGMSNYLIYLLVVFYLQQEPYSLPPLYQLQQYSLELIDGWNGSFQKLPFNSSLLAQSTILELMVGFFQFYGSFDYFTYVITPFFGSKIEKTSFMIPYQLPNCYQHYFTKNKPMFISSGICVQDPFDHSKAVAFSVPLVNVGKFAALCRGALQLLPNEKDLLYNLMLNCKSGTNVDFLGFEIEKPLCLKEEGWIQMIKNLVFVIIREVLCFNIAKVDQKTINKGYKVVKIGKKFRTGLVEQIIYHCTGQWNLFENRINVLKAHIDSIPPNASCLDRDIFVSRCMMNEGAKQSNSKITIEVTLTKDPVSLRFYIPDGPTKLHITHFFFTRIIEAVNSAAANNIEKAITSNLAANTISKPYILQITGRFDNVGLLNEYILKYGSFKSNKTFTQENKTVVQYTFANLNVYLDVITKEHNFSGNILKLDPLAMINQPIPTVTFQNFRLSIIHHILEYPNFTQQVETFQEKNRARKDENEENRRVILDQLNSLFSENSLKIKVDFISNIADLEMETNNIDVYFERTKSFNSEISTLEAVKNLLSTDKNFTEISLIAGSRPYIACKNITTQTYCCLRINNNITKAGIELIRYYISLDPKIASLMMVLKFWADSYDLVAVDAIQSYAFYLLVIFYLQQEYNLSSVKVLQEGAKPVLVNGWNCSFNKKACSCTKLKESSVLDMAYGFFYFYAGFDYISYIVCPYFGSSLEKISFLKPFNLPSCFTKFIADQKDLELSEGLCVLDFFDHSHNLTYNVPLDCVGRFTSLCRNSLRVISEKGNILYKLLLHCQNENLFDFPQFTVPKPPGASTKLWKQNVGNLLQKILSDVLSYQLTQMANFDGNNNFGCVGKHNIWNNRIKVTKTVAAQSGHLQGIDKEVTISTCVIRNLPQNESWNLRVTMNFSSNPNLVNVTFKNKTGQFDMHHVCHFVFTRLKQFLSDTQNEEFSEEDEDAAIMVSKDESDTNVGTAQQVCAVSQIEDVVDLTVEDEEKTIQVREESPTKGDNSLEEGEIGEVENASEEDDVPDDFFDDFNKEDFLDGLELVEEWNDLNQEKEVASLSDSSTKKSKKKKRSRSRSKSKSRERKRRRRDKSERRRRRRSRSRSRSRSSRRNRSRSRSRSSRRKRSRSRSRHLSRRYSRSPPRKTKRKSFLEEIHEKLSEMKPITPPPPVIHNTPNYSEILYSNPGTSVVPPVPAPQSDTTISMIPRILDLLGIPQTSTIPTAAASSSVETYDASFFIGDSALAEPPVPGTQDVLPLVPPNASSITISVQELENPAKLFAEKKITLTQFLALTAKNVSNRQSESDSRYSARKLEVLTRCERAIKIMEPTSTFKETGEIKVKTKPDIKYPSPISIPAFTFTTPFVLPKSALFSNALEKLLHDLGINLKDKL